MLFVSLPPSPKPPRVYLSPCTSLPLSLALTHSQTSAPRTLIKFVAFCSCAPVFFCPLVLCFLFAFFVCCSFRSHPPHRMAQPPPQGSARTLFSFFFLLKGSLSPCFSPNFFFFFFRCSFWFPEATNCHSYCKEPQ
ncbi:hypothetical protein DFJ73DRAFT_63391 [Zopfochytrium polystomum]|nr:hypothetical protein DFJ73DRAFT_63391 [Zopfochytrium polystomum]